MSKKNMGINPKGVFKQLLAEDRSFDPTQIKVYDLVFGTRKIGGKGEAIEQIVSILDTGHGKIDVYPLVQRFAPKIGQSVRCYVTFREGDHKVRGQIKKVMRGFAIPVDLRGAHRDGIWLGLRNNILRLTFRASDREGVAWVAPGPNGKLAIIPSDAGFTPDEGEANYMVSEAMNVFIAHCVVPEEEAKDGSSAGEQGLMLLAEAVGVTLDGVDIFGLAFGGRLYDICEVLGLPTTADTGALEKRYRELAKTEHPDKRNQSFEATTGTKPTDADRQLFNHEWALIEAAKKRFELHLVREAARKSYLKKGREVQPTIPVQPTIKEFAKLIKATVAVTRAASAKIGYPVKNSKDTVSQPVAWTIAGLIASGYNLDDTSDEPDPKSEPAPAK